MPDSYGLLGLFFSAFLAATFLPLSSEAALIAAVASGMEHSSAIAAASLGNILAIIINFALGYWLSPWAHRKALHSKIGRKVFLLSQTYRYSALLLSVLPIIGDPVTIAAGVLRLNFLLFLMLAGTLRILRYWLIVQLF